MDARTYARLRPRIAALTRERRAAWAMLAAVWAGLLLAGGGLGLYLLRLGGRPVHLLASLAAAGALAGWLTPTLLYPFKERFKRELVKPLLEGSLEAVAYAPLGSVSVLDLEGSLLFKTVPPDEVTGEDLVVARRGEVGIRFSELRAGGGLRRKPRLGGERLVYEAPVFQGLFFVADFNKPSPGIVVAYPERWFLARPQIELERVRMEDPRFERLFKVFASDRIFAFYALSPALMETLAAFARGTGPVAFSIVYGKLYLALAGGKNRLEPPLLGTLYSPRLYQGFLGEVELFLKLVDDLRLNRRIWGQMS